MPPRPTPPRHASAESCFLLDSNPTLLRSLAQVHFISPMKLWSKKLQYPCTVISNGYVYCLYPVMQRYTATRTFGSDFVLRFPLTSGYVLFSFALLLATAQSRMPLCVYRSVYEWIAWHSRRAFDPRGDQINHNYLHSVE